MTICRFALFRDLVDDLWPYLNWYFKDFDERKALEDQSMKAGEHLWKHLKRQSVRPEAPLKEFRAFAMASSFLKKYEEGSSQQQDAVALETFMASNNRCGSWSLEMESSGDELLVGLFKEQVYKFLYPSYCTSVVSNLGEVLLKGDVGPGASVGARGTDFYTKLFSSPLTATSRAIFCSYEHYLYKVPHWADADKFRFARFGDVEIVPGNRLTFVPKNDDTSRVICTEPTLNMFLQQGIRQALESRLRSYFGIDLGTQPDINRELARIGSLSGDYCTIDLSAASDSISMRMIEQTFPADFVSWLKFCRSPKCTLPSGEVVELKMISSMGNAFTFPLETIIFSCVVAAAYSSMGISLRKGATVTSHHSGINRVIEQLIQLPNFGVFGDDIIAETRVYGRIVRLLKLLGFSINASKSFKQGPFRESCGGDYFNGHNTRGYYLKSLRTPEARYIAINRINEWSSISGLFAPKTIRRLVKSVRYLPVPLHETPDAGIRVPFATLRQGSSRPKLDGNLSYSYRKWATTPKRIALKDGYIKLPKGAKARVLNSSALLLAFLRGDIEADHMSIRLGSPVFRSKVALTLNWDYEPTVFDGFTPVSGQLRLASAIRINMNS